MSATRLAASVAIMLLLASCASVGTKLKPQRVEPEEIKGSFTVYLYGQRHYEDLNNFALLDAEGDEYELSLYTPEFDYKVLKGVSGPDAIQRAKEFLHTDRPISRMVFLRITDTKGKLIGYELKPLYRAEAYDLGVVYYIDYYLAPDGKVLAYFRSTPDPMAPFGPLNIEQNGVK